LLTRAKGSQGPEVGNLQNILLKLGYDPGPVDSIYGDLTHYAVMAFQQDYGLSVDGDAGPDTWAMLCEAMSNNQYGLGQTCSDSGETLFTPSASSYEPNDFESSIVFISDNTGGSGGNASSASRPSIEQLQMISDKLVELANAAAKEGKVPFGKAVIEFRDSWAQQISDPTSVRLPPAVAKSSVR